MKNFPFKLLIPIGAAIIIFVVLSLAYLNPLLEGKVLKQDDITRFKGMSKEIVDFREETGKEALWTNSMFGGMPAYQISVKYKGNLTRYIDRLFRLGLPRPADMVFLYMIGFFILLMVLGVNPWLSIVGAVAYGFSSYFFIILEAGHNSKAHAIGYLAPALAGILLTYRGKYIAGGILTLLFMALEIRAGHPQITYYMGLLVLIFGAVELVNTIKEKNYLHFSKATAIVVIATLLAVMTNITSLWATWEYGKYTIRGKSELTTEAENRTSGLDKDYATQWSYGISETMTLLIPNVNGGSSRPIGLNKNALDKADAQYRQYVQGTSQYFGAQPFTSGPVYIGAIVVFLFIYGLFTIKGRMKWWLLLGTILSIMLAWGKNFMPLTDFFLEYFPAYNKFRAVAMTLVIAEVTMPILAILALNRFLTDPESLKEKVKISKYKISPLFLSLGITAFLTLIFALIPGTFLNFLTDQELSMLSKQSAENPSVAAQYAELYANIELARMYVVKMDAVRSFLFVLVAGALLWAFTKGKLKLNVTIGVIAVLILVDMWPVNKRYLSNDNFVRKSKMEIPFAKTKADELILKDVDPNFRVMNFTVDPFADASTSYYHKSIGGYHGAKLRRYQELYDQHIRQNFNINVLNMLNAKYFIQPDENNKPSVLPNINALGNAWFVEDFTFVNNADEELAALSNFDPDALAIIDKKFQDHLDGYTPVEDTTALIKLISYKPNELSYQTNTVKDQLVVFSEIYYDKGWNAYVDGKLVPYFRANYVLRSMVLPAGKHLVEFKFEPKVYKTGEVVSFASSLLLILLVLGWLGFEVRNALKEEE